MINEPLVETPTGPDEPDGWRLMPRPRVTDLDRWIGARLRELRMSRGLTQRQMANALGVAYQQLHKVEVGRNRISAGNLWQAMSALGVEPNEFFCGLEAGPGRVQVPTPS